MTDRSAGRLGRLLIVDDDATLLDQMRWALAERFDVVAARDAQEARTLLGSGPDLCLFDLRLPPSGRVEEGLELLKEARRRDPDATVVMMSEPASISVTSKLFSRSDLTYPRMLTVGWARLGLNRVGTFPPVNPMMSVQTENGPPIPRARATWRNEMSATSAQPY